MKHITIISLLTAAALSGSAQFGQSPFGLSVTAGGDKASAAVEISVRINIPADHIIYSESFSVTAADGLALTALKIPEFEEKADLLDPATRVNVFAHSFEALYSLAPAVDGAVIKINYQGCDKSVCFMPESHSYRFDKKSFAFAEYAPENSTSDFIEVDDVVNPWTGGHDFEVAGGYMSTSDFLAFLDKVEGLDVAQSTGFKQFLDDPISFLKKHGMVLTILLVLLGGVLLNMTPCVLPMIPINLAIIGAGAGTRTKGFSLGSAYGTGIIIVYGGLGWIIVRSGGFFGDIQSSPWFNLVIGIVFVLLALALFDLFVIDFAKLVTPEAGTGHKKGLAAAFGAGALSALLAGACVAPVVIAVLLLSTNLYENGDGMVSAQFLPFVLGAGMALPWPFAGAGLSVLPSPGMWMVRIKQFFAVFLLLLAGYYLYVAGSGFLGSDAARNGSILAGDKAAWNAKMEQARVEGKPMLIDFWATWCKNCEVMEKNTFQDEDVKKRLEKYVVVKVQAETPEQGDAREMLASFGKFRGLPLFVVLKLEER